MNNKQTRKKNTIEMVGKNRQNKNNAMYSWPGDTGTLPHRW